MSTPNILVIAVDGLRAAALGAYGNTTYSTPALDDFAARSLLFDWCFADSTELDAICRTLWDGDASLIKSLAATGYATTLITDDVKVAKFESAKAFAEITQLAGDAADRATGIEGTSFARLFAAAGEEVAAAGAGPRLIWLHSHGMFGPWDAPLELQKPLLALEDGDPPPEESITPPNVRLDDTSDPDTAFRWSCAYAAQVMVLDACLAELQHAVDGTTGEWLVVFTGTRGFSLGEHGCIGGNDGRLYAEELHVPLLLRFPKNENELERLGLLASLADVPLAILSVIEGAFVRPGRDALLVECPGGIRSIRTADWSLRTEIKASFDDPTVDASTTKCELFVRPDDRWEANNVAGLLPDVVDELLARLAAGPAN